jgi:hypothetical protein
VPADDSAPHREESIAALEENWFQQQAGQAGPQSFRAPRLLLFDRRFQKEPRESLRTTSFFLIATVLQWVNSTCKCNFEISD